MAELDRRTVLVALGLLGVAAGPGLAPRAAQAAVDEMTTDTLSGLAVFVMPGPDPYSRVQGTPRAEPGAIEARLPAFLADALDRYLPAPTLDAGPLVDAIRRAGFASNATGTIPLSALTALLLNLEAVLVEPAAAFGPFRSPFARLSYARKARVFELIEGPEADLVRLLDAALPEPLTGTASGLLRFAGGALLELAALGGYGEWAVFDPATRRPRTTPVGWQDTGYVPSVDGWAEFRGYFQGRREVGR